MTRKFMGLACGALLALGGCTPADAPVAEITDLHIDETPLDVRALAEGAADGFTIAEVQKKVRGERTYFDVEGTLPDGSEIEFDILMTPAGPEIVETQRDLDWAEVPGPVREAAERASPGAAPARVIESTQADGLVIFELFAPGEPAEPAMEVSWDGREAGVLAERWPH